MNAPQRHTGNGIRAGKGEEGETEKWEARFRGFLEAAITTSYFSPSTFSADRTQRLQGWRDHPCPEQHLISPCS